METLTQLKSKQVKLGIVTNCVKKDYDQILRRLGAESCFDVVVGIDSCNRCKPDSRIFLYAADRLQLIPSEIIFVGDSVERDYEGATRVGFKSLLIDRKGNASKSVDSIRSLTEVLLFF
jgi:HAD superfamily hydrolase (TIGR01549 family)